MNREELLKHMTGKITENDFSALEVWTKKREKFLWFFYTKFDLDPISCGTYTLSAGNDCIELHPFSFA